MNTQLFKSIYSVPRNGANAFYRHPLARNVLLSDGVHDLANTGCWWLIDLIATEGASKLRRNPDAAMLIVKVKVKDTVASVRGKLFDEKPPQLRHRVDYTDLPDGEWMFYLGVFDETRFSLILPTEY